MVVSFYNNLFNKSSLLQFMPEWNPDKRIAYWDKSVQPYFRGHAAVLLDNLRTRRQIIGLTEAPNQTHDSHMIHIQKESNPSWYRNLVNNYSYHTHRGGKIRCPDGRLVKTSARIYRRKGWKNTKIRRDRVISALGRIVIGDDMDVEGNGGKIVKRVDVGHRKHFPESRVVSRPKNYVYHARMRELIFDRLTEGYKMEGDFIYPEVVVLDYFGIPHPEGLDGHLEVVKSLEQSVKVNEVSVLSPEELALNNSLANIPF